MHNPRSDTQKYWHNIKGNTFVRNKYIWNWYQIFLLADFIYLSIRPFIQDTCLGFEQLTLSCPGSPRRVSKLCFRQLQPFLSVVPLDMSSRRCVSRVTWDQNTPDCRDCLSAASSGTMMTMLQLKHKRCIRHITVIHLVKPEEPSLISFPNFDTQTLQGFRFVTDTIS